MVKYLLRVLFLHLHTDAHISERRYHMGIEKAFWENAGRYGDISV